MNDPFFSIIIPTFNRAHLIDAPLQSAGMQDFLSYEVLIIDDGSTDNTKDKVRPWLSDRVKYYRKCNGERAAARNFGVRHARGRYIYFLDSDDTIYPSHLSAAAKIIGRTLEPPLLITRYDTRRRDGTLIRGPRRLRNLQKQILWGNPISCHGVFVRSDVIRREGFCERRDLSGMEDWELWLRLLAQYPAVVVQEVTATLIEHEGRSVGTDSIARIEAKVQAFQEEVMRDGPARRVYGNKLVGTLASASSYAALHVALAGAPRGRTLQHLVKSVLYDPRIMLTKRFAVILRAMLLGR